MIGKISHQLSLARYSVRAIGPGRMARNALRWATDGEARTTDSGFDAAYGTDTNAALSPREAGLPLERSREATMYLPTMDCDFDASFDALDWPDDRLRASTFIDLGSGKGRAVFLAAMRPLRAAIGVELSPVLHQIALANLAIMSATGVLQTPVRFELGDAGELSLPDGPVILYLYHPFRASIADEVLRHVIAAVAARRRPAALLYCHPTLQRPLDPALFERDGIFSRHADGARATRRFRIGWTVWTNADWLESR